MMMLLIVALFPAESRSTRVWLKPLYTARMAPSGKGPGTRVCPRCKTPYWKQPAKSCKKRLVWPAKAQQE